MVEPSVIQAIANLGATGLLIIAVWAFATDRIVTGKRLKETNDACESRIAKLEAKLEAGTNAIERQATALQGQIDAQKELIRLQQRQERSKT
jgi:hypothetical protein